MNIAYVRVSTVDQNEQRQVEGISSKHDIDKWFTEKVSGKDRNRPQLEAMLEFARQGDTIYIHDLSRLARSTKDLLELVETLTNKGIFIKSDKEDIDTSSPTGKFILTMLSAINQFERENMLERQREGIAIAKKAGKYHGKSAIDIPNFDVQYARYTNRDITKVQLAKELGISRPTLDKLIAKM